MELKTCSVCGIQKEASDFHKRTASKDGLSPKCKICDRACNAKWRSDNASKEKERKRKYFSENSERAKTYSCAWQQSNPEKVKEIVNKWKKSNRGKVNQFGANRRAAKLQATPAWADQEKIAEFYFAADFLGMVTGEWYHVDHIVPLQSKLVCGLHDEFNLQVLPAKENIKKSNRFWPDMPD
jgi:hypothetical protein